MPHLFPALIAKGLSFATPSGRVILQPTDLTISPGEIHALVGLSGAGKSVLAKILAGILSSPTGTIHVQGQLKEIHSEADAQKTGIRIVKQEVDLNPRFAVLDVLDLGPVPRRFGFVDTKAHLASAKAHLSMFGLGAVDPNAHVATLTPGQQKLLQLACCLQKSASLLILDDPASSMTEAEAKVLYDRLAQLQYAETGVLYLCDSAQEALEVGDQISVMRDGRLLATHFHEDIFVPQLAGEMVGRDNSNVPPRRRRIIGPEMILRIEAVSVDPHLLGGSLKVKRSEIFGRVGLSGAGQSEFLRAIAGAEPRTEGAVFLRGAGTPSRTATVEQSLISGLGFIPDPFQSEVLNRSYLSVGSRQLLRALNASHPLRSSVAKCIDAGCVALLFDRPFHGLNVTCRYEAIEMFQDLAETGSAVVIASTELQEMLKICDRIGIMSNGRLVRTLERADFDLDKIRTLLKNPR